jgi:hypothetical protein
VVLDRGEAVGILVLQRLSKHLLLVADRDVWCHI